MDLEINTAPARWWRERELLCVIVVVLIAHFFRLNQLSIRGEESRRFLIGWEMIESGDWIVPRMQGDPVFFRPPLQNWLLGISAWLCGTWDAWVIRLPGAFAVLGTAIIIYGYSRRFLSAAGAFCGGACFATMAQVLELGRLAETESLFTFLVSAALLIWHWGYTAAWPDLRMWIAAYALAGLGMLAKGAQAPVYLTASAGVFLLWQRQWRRLFTFAHLAGLGTFALVFGAWWVPYALNMGLSDGWRIIVGDTSQHVHVAGEFLRHLWQFPLETLSCMLPWSLLLPLYLSGKLWRSLGQARPMVGFVLTCVVVTLPSCWLVSGGAPRYWMPLYACVAILIGAIIERGLASSSFPVVALLRTFLSGFAVVMLIVAALALIACLPGLQPNRFRQPWSYAVAYAVALGTLGCLVLARKDFRTLREFGSLSPGNSLLLVAAPALGLALTNSIWLLNYQDQKSYDMSAEVNRLKGLLPDSARLVSFGQVDHRFAYFYGKSINQAHWPAGPADLPSSGVCFCFDVGAARPLPFRWEKITEVVCARFRNAEITNRVVVGRYVGPQQTVDGGDMQPHFSAHSIGTH